MWASVELREIRAFLILAEELHFRRAAQRLGVTPSRVSQIIRTLETRAGGQLFERTSRAVTLTPLGEQLLRDARPACRRLEQAFRDASEAATGVSGTLRLGMYAPVNGGPHLVEIIRTFQARHPACRVTLTDTGFARGQLDWLHTEELDMLAMRLPINDTDIAIGPVLSCENRVLAVASDHVLAASASVSVEALADYVVADVQTLPREMMDAFIPPRTPSGRRVRRIVVRTIDESLLRVALGETVHPTVLSFLDHSRHPGISSIAISDLPPSETALIWLAASSSPKIDAFARAAADVLRGAGSGL